MPENANLHGRKWKANDLVLMHPDGIRSSIEELRADLAGLMPRVSPTAALLSVYGAGLDAGENKSFAYLAGVAIIPISGSLWHRFSGSYGWVTGYTAIQRQFRAALADDDVTAIVFDVDSYGGDAAGCFELSEEIYNARGAKPIHAVVDAHCYSAAYALASAADRMTVTRTGGVGSIGVVMMTVDASKFYEDAGITYNLIYAGDHKVDGNPYEKLSPKARARFQARVDSLYDEFVTTVARNRGIDASAVRKTEAATFGAAEALELGLVDAIGTPQEALTALFAELSGSKPFGDKTMSTQTEQPEAQAAAPAAAPVEAPKQETPAAEAPAAPAASADAAEQERGRIAAILSCEEAKGRASLAQHFAFKTNMTADDARAALAAAPAEAAAAPAKSGSFERAMAEGNPNIGADDGGNSEPSAAQKILSDFASATGYQPVKH